MMMKNDSGTCGIYKITRKDTGQAYIGLSENIERRWDEHIHSPKLKYSYIDRAIRKHGVNKFHLEIVEELPNNRALLAERERYWIAYYNTYKDGSQFNLTPGGDISPSKLPEIKAKISEKRIGIPISDEVKKKISCATNTTGFFRVDKLKCSDCKNGFTYRYRYYDDDGKHRSIISVDLEKLEKKVKQKGLPWFKLEE